jgi:hypothetical protein
MINSSSATAAAHRDPSLERRLGNPKILSGAQLQAEGFHDLQDRVEARAPLAGKGLVQAFAGQAGISRLGIWQALLGPSLKTSRARANPSTPRCREGRGGLPFFHMPGERRYPVPLHPIFPGSPRSISGRHDRSRRTCRVSLPTLLSQEHSSSRRRIPWRSLPARRP